MRGNGFGAAKLHGRKFFVFAENDHGPRIDILKHSKVPEEGNTALPALMIDQHRIEASQTTTGNNSGQVEGLEIVGRRS